MGLCVSKREREEKQPSIPLRPQRPLPVHPRPMSESCASNIGMYNQPRHVNERLMQFKG